ncbi:MAG: transposase [Nitrospiraceae bacterium]|nr:transposase [Nitrospiraceae bacterium]
MNKPTIARYLSQLKGKSDVKYVAMDMWNSYRDAVKSVLPNANIIIDKFHVVRMANEAMERVRKSLRSSLQPKQRRTLMHDRFILLKRQKMLLPKRCRNSLPFCGVCIAFYRSRWNSRYRRTD